MIRVASVLDESDHISTIVLTIFFKSFLKERRYGSNGMNAVNVSLRVAASDRVVRRWWIDAVCDLRRGERVRNFLDSVATWLLTVSNELNSRRLY